MIAILTGLQRGVDQGAAATALDMGAPIAGWYPKDGRDELGPIPLRFVNPSGMQRCRKAGLAARTQLNVADCHALLVIVEDAQRPYATPGTRLTLDERRIAHPGKPHWVVDPNVGSFGLDSIAQAIGMLDWERRQRGLHVTRLMVAGPRASLWADGEREAGRFVRAILEPASG